MATPLPPEQRQLTLAEEAESLRREAKQARRKLGLIVQRAARIAELATSESPKEDTRNEQQHRT